MLSRQMPCAIQNLLSKTSQFVRRRSLPAVRLILERESGTHATGSVAERSVDPNRGEDRYGKLPTCSLRFSAQPRGADFRSGIAAVPTAAACEPEAFAVKRAPRLKWLSLKTASLGFCWEHPLTCVRKSKPRLSCIHATEFANRPSPEQSS